MCADYTPGGSVTKDAISFQKTLLALGLKIVEPTNLLRHEVGSPLFLLAHVSHFALILLTQ